MVSKSWKLVTRGNFWRRFRFFVGISKKNFCRPFFGTFLKKIGMLLLKMLITRKILILAIFCFYTKMFRIPGFLFVVLYIKVCKTNILAAGERQSFENFEFWVNIEKITFFDFLSKLLLPSLKKCAYFIKRDRVNNFFDE